MGYGECGICTKMKNKLLYGGILAPLLYLLHDIIGNILTPNYNLIINTISDLTKSGSTYLLGSIILFISALLGITFGIGLIINKYKLPGILLTIISTFNLFTATIFPQDPIGTSFTFPGIMHLVLVGISAILIFPTLIIMGLKIKKLKRFTFTCVIIMFISGILSGLFIAKNIPLLGLIERISIYAYQTWSVITASFLIRNN